MTTLSRRKWLQTALAAAATAPHVARAAVVAPWPSRLAFSLYGMKSLALDDALAACAEIGYAGVELALLSGFPTEPTTFGPADRRRLRDQLTARQLALSGVMENLVAAAPTEAEHRRNLDRLARAVELARDVGGRPLVETVLGGKPADWPDVRNTLTDRLRDWAETARKHEAIVAVKPHVSGAVHLPASAAQLLAAVDSPHLQAVYDFSHYQVQGLALEPTLAALSERTVFVHVKDGRRTDGKVQFLLPGDGGVDYPQLFRLLDKHRYPGMVTVEVSSQLSSRADYDPRAAARRSFENLRAAAETHAAAPIRNQP